MMSYRIDICEKITAALHESPYDEKKIEKTIELFYVQVLKEAKMTGHSVESVTYEVLEGIDEGMTKKPEKVEDTLKSASRSIADIIHKSAKKTICEKKRKVRFAKAELRETIEAEKVHLNESLEAFKHYAREKSYRKFEMSLQEREREIVEYIHKITDKFQYNHIHKIKDSYDR